MGVIYAHFAKQQSANRCLWLTCTTTGAIPRKWQQRTMTTSLRAQCHSWSHSSPTRVFSPVACQRCCLRTWCTRLGNLPWFSSTHLSSHRVDLWITGSGFKSGFQMVKSASKPTRSWTPIQANINSNNEVIMIMLPIVPIATNTHWTTCFRPLARLMARSGRRTRRTRKILITEMVEPAFGIRSSKMKIKRFID